MSEDTIDKKTLIAVRPYAGESDRNFIFATFLMGLYYGDRFYHEIPKDIFMANYHRVVERLLDSPGITIRVACLKDDPDVILGYSLSRTVGLEGQPKISILDWVFVKKAWRKIGIGKSLVPDPLHAVTHLTTVGKAIKPSHVLFNPFLL